MRQPGLSNVKSSARWRSRGGSRDPHTFLERHGLSVMRRPGQHPDFTPDITGSLSPHESEGAHYFGKTNGERGNNIRIHNPKPRWRAFPRGSWRLTTPDSGVPAPLGRFGCPPPGTGALRAFGKGKGRTAPSAPGNAAPARLPHFGCVFKGHCFSGFGANANTTGSLTSTSRSSPPHPVSGAELLCGEAGGSTEGPGVRRGLSVQAARAAGMPAGPQTGQATARPPPRDEVSARRCLRRCPLRLREEE